MPGPPIARCDHCSTKFKLRSADSIGKSLACPKCGEEFVVRPLKRTKRRPADEPGLYSNDPTDTSSPSDTAGRLPGRSRRRKRTPMDDAREKRDALLRKKEEQDRANQPKEAAWALVATILTYNAHVATLLTIGDCATEFFGLVGEMSFRAARGPVVIVVITLILWYQTVLSRDINQRATAAAGGMFFIIVCGVIGAVTVNAVNRVTGHDFFEVRWGAVYLGISLVLFSIWGYGRETPVEYAERMMSRGKFASATATIERVLEKDPDDLQALKIQQELRQMMTM